MTSRNRGRRHKPLRLEDERKLEDNRELFVAPSRGETKVYQLCRQVEEAVSCALACAHNALIRDLYVAAVEPIRGTALLRVMVYVEHGEVEYEALGEALVAAMGYFRGEVARGIHRKRVPSLDFVIVPMPENNREESHEE